MNEQNLVKNVSTNYSIDRPKAQNPIKIMDVSLRDGHQSLFAARGRTEDMILVAEMMDKVGFWAIETWGGATFDTMHRFLNEDPWERIRTLKRYFKKTPFSMLLRGQNLVGYRNYADDLAKAFVEKSIENGIDIFRTFDALNDYRNFETVVKSIKKTSKHFQGCICYTLTEPRLGGKVYNLKYYLDKAKNLESMGADSICIKDMAGLLAPYDAYQLIKNLKQTLNIPIHLHSHFTSGMSSMTHLKAIEAGVDIIDTCMSPYAYRNSHPAIEPLVITLLGTNRDTGFDINLLSKINDIFEKKIISKYEHLLDNSKFSIIDTNVLLHQTPGGMLSSLINQLKEMDALDKIDQVFKELPKVRKELGQIPLVTPTSQIVGIQTVNNVLFDTPEERYKMITGQVKDLCYGLYGKTAIPIDKKLQKKALIGYERGENPIKCRPAEVLKPELEEAKKNVGDLAIDLEDLILYALYPVTGKKFLRWKYGKEEAPEIVKPITIDDVKKRKELIAKAISGKLIEKKHNIPTLSENKRKFNVVIDNDHFEVEVDEIESSPRISKLKNIKMTDLSSSHSNNNTSNSLSPKSESRPDKKEPKISFKSTNNTNLNNNNYSLIAPMPGMIVKYEKKVGDEVSKGETVVVLEAMKMENALPAPVNGIIKNINVKSGDTVSKDDILCIIEKK